MDFDLELRTAIYRHFADTGRAPAAETAARAVGCTPAEARAGFQRLAAARMLVLMPDGEAIRMALPFSGIETQHEVHVRGTCYYANCAWDAFGIPAALQEACDVRSRCEWSRQPLHVRVGGDAPLPAGWVFHAAVPAADWWHDIVYT